MGRPRVLIVSDDQFVRIGLQHILRAAAEVFVATECKTIEDLFTILASTDADVVAIEIDPPGIHGLRTVGTVLKARPETKILILTSNRNPSYLRAMLAAGVKAYVLKASDESEFLTALDHVHSGRRYIDPRLGNSMVDLLVTRTGHRKPLGTPSLSKRELQVLRGIARGFTSNEIARQYRLSAKTVMTYRSRIYEKLNLRTRADLVHYAISSGILDLKDEI